ncbi:MAG: hypothetical protein LBJ64_03570 [Deltaproteobacteria bacterium]|jgi:hypothetical protein|nr:hypothetical protein [Deltaproteobacteria bacterium]
MPNTNLYIEDILKNKTHADIEAIIKDGSTTEKEILSYFGLPTSKDMLPLSRQTFKYRCKYSKPIDLSHKKTVIHLLVIRLNERGAVVNHKYNIREIISREDII